MPFVIAYSRVPSKKNIRDFTAVFHSIPLCDKFYVLLDIKIEAYPETMEKSWLFD